MTLLTTNRATGERGNGVQRNFYFDFPVLEADELFVYIKTDDVEGSVLRTDYTITGLGNPNGGSIYFSGGAAPTAAQVVHIQRWVENTQETNYVENDPFPADAHEDTLDRIVMMIQQTLQFEGVADPGAFIMWDSEGEKLINGPDYADDITNAGANALIATQAYLDALEAAMAAGNWAGGALNTDFTYNGLTSKSAYHYATLAMVYTIFPVNTICWFGQMTAPIGWTIQTNFDDCLIGVRSTTAGGTYYVATNPWTLQSLGSSGYNTVAINGVGDTMLAGSRGPGRLYRSIDFGANWGEIYPPGGTPANKYWHDVAMSTTGDTMLAGVYGGRLYLSTNHGANWLETTPDGPFDRNWSAMDCSDDGTYLYACVYDASSYGKVWYSGDGGTTWVQRYPKGVGNLGNWQDMKCSVDGSRIAVIEYNGRLWTSSDYGVNWTERRPAGNVDATWYALGMDSDGSHIIAVANAGTYGNIYVSTDYGVSWAARSSNAAWYCAGCNADGSYMAAAINSGRYYYSTDSGATFGLDANLSSSLTWRDVDFNAVGDRVVICYYTSIDTTPGRVYVSAPVAAPTTMYGSWDLGSHTHPQTVHSHTVGTISISLPSHNHQWLVGPNSGTYDVSGNAISVGSYKSGKTTTGLINEVTKANSREANADFYTSFSSGAGGTATGSTANSGATNTGSTAMGSAWRPYAAIGIVAKLTTIPVA